MPPKKASARRVAQLLPEPEQHDAELKAANEAEKAIQDAEHEAEVEVNGSDGDEEEEEEEEATSDDPRAAKLAALRRRLQESSQANRRDVNQEAAKRRALAQETKRLDRKRAQAEAFAEKLEAEETGEDLERKRNWEYTVEDSEAWDKKLAKKARRAHFEFTGE